MPPVSWLHRHLWVSPAFITRPSPPGLAALQTVPGELRFSRPCKDTATSLFGSSPSVSRTLTSASGHSPEPPGSTERLRAFTGAPSLTDGTFETHRTTRSSTDNLGCPPDDFGRPTGASCSPRASSDAHRNLRVPPESLRRLRSQFVQTRRFTVIASFRYNGPIVRRPLAELCNVSGATVVTFESTPGFRLSYRR